MKAPLLAITVGILGICAAGGAQTPVPTPRPTPWAAASSEFPVNESTGIRQAPAVAMGQDSKVMAVWHGPTDGDGLGIFARLFNAACAPLGGEFQVNTTTTGYQYTPAIASDPAGNSFVVVWASSTTETDADIRAQRFDSNGTPVGSEILVNAYTTGRQVWPDVAAGSDGFTVVWMNGGSSGLPGPAEDPDGVYMRRFSADGTPQGGDVLVNTYTTGFQFSPKVSSNSYGSVVVWQSADQDGDMSGIYEQAYDPSGSPAGPERLINSHTAGDQTAPNVAMGAYGPEYMIAWRTLGTPDADGIWGRGVNRSGDFLGPEFRVSRNGGGYGGPSVAFDPIYDGGFIVAWSGLQSAAAGGPGFPQTPPPLDTAIFAQRFDNAPFPTTGFYYLQPPRRGETFQVDTQTFQRQSFPDIAWGQGRFVVAWQSNFEDGTVGIEARRFDLPRALPMKVDARPSGGASNVNGVLESGERVVVEPAWRSLATPAMPLSGTASNATGPAGPVYAIEDGTADYGMIDNDGADCFTATANCYEVTVSGARPAAHWDATFNEALDSSDPLGPTSKTWSLHVGGSFPDVPQDSFYPFIENLFHNGVTTGGACGAGLYCGDEPVLRQQMAVFLLKAAYGQGFVPPEATGGVFDDVPVSNPFAPWIEELARIGVTAGCTAPPPPALPSYCPSATVNRQQMAAFLVKTYLPWGGSACTGQFEDVSCSNPFAIYIQYLADRGIASGCSASPPLFCPTDPTKRKQMAAFLVKTFELQLYGPD
jgi:hypothetical protein